MKKCSVIKYMMLVLVLVLAFPELAFANSSWRWISETRPYDVLPFVIAVTLGVEIFAVNLAAKASDIRKTALWVILANLLSFAAPYIMAPVLASINPIYDLEQMMEHTPMYTVGAIFLIMTLLVEVPIVYAKLRNGGNKKRLITVLIIVNICTTIFTAMAERMISPGRW